MDVLSTISAVDKSDVLRGSSVADAAADLPHAKMRSKRSRGAGGGTERARERTPTRRAGDNIPMVSMPDSTAARKTRREQRKTEH